MNDLKNPPVAGAISLPCAQPMDPSLKRHYLAALAVLVCAVVYVNFADAAPAPLACRAELSQ